MQKVHFIGIGGSSMYNLAIAIRKKNNFQITVSDIEIADEAYTQLKENNLLPEKLGWFPEKINKGLSAVVIGAEVKLENPELLTAKELGLKIYSFPEFILHQTRSKTRIVITGTHGKRTTIAMILFALKKLKTDVDYVISFEMRGISNLIRLTYDARIIIIEDNENVKSTFLDRLKNPFYKPHIAILTGIETNEMQASQKDYLFQIKNFIEKMEVQGRLIYFDGEEMMNDICMQLRRDIVSFPYNFHEYKIIDGITYLITKKTEIPLNISGIKNLEYLNAARIACRQIGVTDDDFYSAIADFNEDVMA